MGPNFIQERPLLDMPTAGNMHGLTEFVRSDGGTACAQARFSEVTP